MYDLQYQYEPGAELPHFSIHLNGVPIASTNGEWSRGDQEKAARLFAASHRLFEALEHMLDADGDLYAMDFEGAREALVLAKGDSEIDCMNGSAS
ncbi:hypothetical protein [Phaeovulum sp.]|uniref:hypothetical protein n=1 Tax=Phaeovulum sp. TaxID=2934796 RepID=UPI0035679DA3